MTCQQSYRGIGIWSQYLKKYALHTKCMPTWLKGLDESLELELDKIAPYLSLSFFVLPFACINCID